MNTEYLSISRINMFLRCPRQYEFRYVQGRKIPPAGAMVLGKAYHDTLEKDLTSKIQTGELLDEGDISDIFSDSFNSQVNNRAVEDEGETVECDSIDWGDDDPGQMKDEGITLARLYHNEFAPLLAPLEVEQKKETSINKIPFVLIADVIEEKKIIDHKVKKRRFSEDDIKRDLQATAYTYVYQKPFEFHQALRQKKPIIDIVETTRGTQDWTFFDMLVPKVWQAIHTGIFYPCPTGWHCSESFCGYWSLCKGK